MICCYQVTEIYSSKYGFAIASSAWSPCNFGPFTDLAISVFREMSLNTVLTQILTSLDCGLQRNFMRRSGVRPPCNGISSSTKFSLNSCSHSGISESPHGFPRYIVVSFLFGFGISLGWISSGFPDLSSTNSDTGTGEMSLSGASSFARTETSSTVGEEGEDEEDEEE